MFLCVSIPPNGLIVKNGSISHGVFSVSLVEVIE